MNNFEFSFPTMIKFGKDAHMQTGNLLSNVGKKALIHFGSDRIRKSGFLELIENLLQKEGVEYIEFGGVQANPSVEMVEKGVELCRQEKVDCILAIGGGSVVDSAKAIAMGVFSDGGIWDMYSGKSALPSKALPIGVIVTIPATASEANCLSVISNYEEHDKRVLGNPACTPKFAILNPELTVTISAYQTAVAAADIFSHCFERYVDLRRGSILWDALCEATMKTVIEVTPKLIQEPNNYDLRCELMWAATVAHSDMLGTGGDFACHGLSHVLTSVYGLPHGEALGLIMPAWSTYVVEKAREKFKTFGENVWGIEDGQSAIASMKNFINAIGLPTNMNQTDIKEYDPKELADHAFAGEEEFLGGGLTRINQEDAEAIFRLLKH